MGNFISAPLNDDTFAQQLVEHFIGIKHQQKFIDVDTNNNDINGKCSASKLSLPGDIFAQMRATMTWWLEPNRIVGQYESVHNYLLTHMRLLHADYLTALHDGLRDLQQQRQQQVSAKATLQSTYFWVYPNKHIKLTKKVHSPDLSNYRFVVRLTAAEMPQEMLRRAFMTKQQRLNENMVNRPKTTDQQQQLAYELSYGDEEGVDNKVPFMAGSLLLFTSDVAKMEDLVVATVVSQNLEESYVEIHLIRVYNTTLQKPLIMLESKSYFDPTHQVYRTLGSLTDSKFPMREQLLDVSVEPFEPSYLRNADAVYRHPSHPSLALPLRPANAGWPAAHALGYDPGQLAAIRHALTHRLAMIQGPPGTGKSYVGRELVGLLLHNTKHRIVIVCNSNQALDQFMAGLIGPPAMAGVDPALVVRLGQQCKEYSLRGIVRSAKCVDETIVPHGYPVFQAFQTISERNECVNKLLLSHRQMPVGYAGYERSELHRRLGATAEARHECEALHQKMEYEMIKKMRVVGMTSSFAARNDTLLKLLKAPIVIVEEAAEMLETHVVAALTEHTQHLIMIGDHQQLRPHATTFNIGRDAFIDISLFERLHNNDLPAVALSRQHRMHPQLANLIRPSIYEVLTDAPQVVDFPMVRGMPARVMFVDHRFGERRAEGTTSYCNEVEAKLVQRLCYYLLQQAYQPDDITVLCTYRAQLSLLETKARTRRCHGCRIAVVDGYQGRESRIVLLSLVRNNREGNVGFMYAANRACVALSRAREGLYMFGNMDMMAARSSVWQHVRDRLGKEENCIGPLKLQCDRHNNMTEIRKPEDFQKTLGGGCAELCQAVHKCKRACTIRCHGRGVSHVCSEANCMATVATAPIIEE